MAYYSDIVVDEQTKAPRAGVSITVLKADGSLAFPEPLVTNANGFFSFNAADAVYTLELRYGGRLVRQDEVIVGLPPEFIGPPGPSGSTSVADSLGTATTIAPSQRAVNAGLAGKASVSGPFAGTSDRALRLDTARTIGTPGSGTDVLWSVQFAGNADAFGAMTIAPRAVTNAKMGVMPAFTLKGALSDGLPADLLPGQALSVIGVPAYVKGVLGSRQAHVLDIADWDSTGIHDNATGYQTLVNQAANNNVDLVATSGQFLLSRTIVLPDGHSFRGKYGAGFATDPNRASSFHIAHTGKGFTRSGGGTAAISIVNQSTFRDQPAVGTGLWTPTDHDFDYYFEDISDLRMHGIRTTNATRGIFMNGGRNSITDWLGQHFKIGLQIDWSYDTVTLDNLHLWPMWNQSTQIRDYSQNNLTSIKLGRVDNPFFTRIFSIWHQVGIDIGRYAGDGPSKPAGTVSKLKLIGADIDIGDFGYRVRPEADGHTAQWSAVSMQARDTAIASSLVEIEGPNTEITGDVRLSNSGGNGFHMASTAAGSEIALLTRINDWNRTGTGFPAVEVAAGGGHFDFLPGSRAKNGSGAATTSGNVTVWTP